MQSCGSLEGCRSPASGLAALVSHTGMQVPGVSAAVKTEAIRCRTEEKVGHTKREQDVTKVFPACSSDGLHQKFTCPTKVLKSGAILSRHVNARNYTTACHMTCT